MPQATEAVPDRVRTACALCSEMAHDRILAAADPLVPGQTLDLVRCRACRHVFVDPRPADLGPYYAGAYWNAPGARPATLAAAAEKRYRGFLLDLDVARIRAVVPGGARLLDVGCGSGDLSARLAARGFKVIGVEVAAQAAAAARDGHGLDVRPGSLKDAAFPDGHFDVAIVWHVLEHVDNPVGLLREILRVLVPGGTVLVQVPNYESLQAQAFGKRWFALDLPRHLNHFSPESLGRAMRLAGFATPGIRHGSLRHDPVILASSLWPALSPHRPPAGALAKLAYLTLTWLVAPWTVLEAGLGRGAVITAVARRPDPPPER